MKKLADELPVLRSVSDWTDEQWAEHDAKVSAQIAEERRVSPRAEVQLSRDHGWPLLCIENLAITDESSPSIVQLAKWNHREHCIAVLAGGVGCGKTTAAAWWAHRRASRALFVRSSTFARASRYSAQRDEWMEAQGLVLDDLGTEYTDEKGALVGDLEELIDIFYADRKPLLITTNLAPASFTARYGDRITDRLRQHGRWLGVVGASMRRRA